YHARAAEREILARVVEWVAVGRVAAAEDDPVTQVGAVQVGQRVPVLLDERGRVAPLVLGGDHHRGVDVAEEQVLAAQLHPRVPALGVGEARHPGPGGVVVAVGRVRAGRVLDAPAERAGRKPGALELGRLSPLRNGLANVGKCCYASQNGPYCSLRNKTYGTGPTAAGPGGSVPGPRSRASSSLSSLPTRMAMLEK